MTTLFKIINYKLKRVHEIYKDELSQLKINQFNYM